MHHGRSSMPLWMTGGDIWRPLTFSFKDRRASVARSARRARTRCAFAETVGLLSNFSCTSLQTEKQIYLKTDFQLAKRHLQAGVQSHNALGSSWECFSVPVFVDAIAVVVADALTHTFVKIIYHGLAHTCVKVVYHHHPFPMQRHTVIFPKVLLLTIHTSFVSSTSDLAELFGISYIVVYQGRV